MYGHLCCTDLAVNDQVTAGQVIGRIGDSHCNGGWFPHLHLQVMEQRYVSRFESRRDEPEGFTRYEDIDGYIFERANAKELEDMGVIDPMAYLTDLDFDSSSVSDGR